MESTKKCPYCGEEIMADAKKCRYCGEWFENSCSPILSQIPSDKSIKTSSKSKRKKVIIISACIIAIVAIVAASTILLQDEKITPSIQTFLYLNKMKDEEVIKVIESQGWNRIETNSTGEDTKAVFYQNPEYNNFLISINKSNGRIVEFKTPDSDLYREWNNELEKMGYKIVEDVTLKDKSVFKTYEKDSDIYSSVLSSAIIQYSDPTCTSPIGIIYSIY